jgi:hypothetical protein
MEEDRGCSAFIVSAGAVRAGAEESIEEVEEDSTFACDADPSDSIEEVEDDSASSWEASSSNWAEEVEGKSTCASRAKVFTEKPASEENSRHSRNDD